MRKNRLGIIGLAAVFLLLAAAVGLNLNSVALTNHANFRKQINDIGMYVGVPSYGGNDDSYKNRVQSFIANFAGEKDLHYNIIVLKPNGDVQYKLNDNFLPGDKAIFVSDGVAATLTDKATGKELWLEADSAEGNGIGSAEDVKAANPEDEPQNPGAKARGDGGLTTSGPAADNEAEPSLPLMLRSCDRGREQENNENR